MVGVLPIPEPLIWVCPGIFPWPWQGGVPLRQASMACWKQGVSISSPMREKCQPSSPERGGNDLSQSQSLKLPEIAVFSAGVEMQGGACWILEGVAFEMSYSGSRCIPQGWGWDIAFLQASVIGVWSSQEKWLLMSWGERDDNSAHVSWQLPSLSDFPQLLLPQSYLRRLQSDHHLSVGTSREWSGTKILCTNTL